MGRWAQRTRRGGGPPLPGECITVLAVVIDDVDAVLVTFSSPVTAGDFVVGDLVITIGSGPVAGGQVDQVAPTVLAWLADDWTGFLNAGQAWVLTTAVSGVCSPQSGALA